MAQTIIVDISTRGANPVAYTHQGDTGRTFFAEIYENGEAFAVAGYTIKVGAILPADRGYTVIAGNDMVTATKTNDNTTNKIYFTLSNKYSLKAGNGILTLIFTSNTGTPSTIRPINIDLRIQKSADADDVIAGASDFPEGLEEIADSVFQEYLSTYLPPVAPSSSADANKAASAKLTGQELDNLKSDLNYNHTAEPGYVLRATDSGHGNEWAMVGTPTDAQAETAINKWLDEHPEATTTVQDWSLEYNKLVRGTLGFVIPEMYGAKGNGIADDTSAVQSAINSGKSVLLISEYKVRAITIENEVEVFGNGYGKINAEETLAVKSSNVLFRDFEIFSDNHNTLISVGTSLFGIKNIKINNVRMYYSTPTGSEIALAFDYTNNFTVCGCSFDVAGIDVRHCVGFVFSGNTHDGKNKNDNESIHCSVYTENGVIENSQFKNLKMEAIDTYSSGSRLRITNNTFDTFQAEIISIKIVLRDSPYIEGSSDQPDYGYTEFINISNNVIRNYVPQTQGASCTIIDYYFSDYRENPVHDNTNMTNYIIINGNMFENIYPQNESSVSGVRYACIGVLGTGSVITNNIFSGLYVAGADYRTCAIRIGTDQSVSAAYENTPQFNIIEGNVISSKTSGIVLNNCENTIISGNTFRKDERYNTVCRYPVYITGNPKNLTIANNHFYASSNGSGIYPMNTMQKVINATISGNVFSGDSGASGIDLLDADYCNITCNTFDGTALRLGKNASDSVASLNKIANNTLIGNGGTYAILVYGQNGLNVNGNNAYNFGTFIRFLQSCNNCLVSNNITKNVATFKNVSSLPSDLQATITDVNNISYSVT